MDKDRQKARDAVAQMSLFSKVKYICREYRFHALAAVLLAALILVSVKNIAEREKTVLWGMIINQTAAVPEDLSNEIGLDEKETVSVLNGVMLDVSDIANTASLSYGNALQLSCAAAAGELDFVFTDADGLALLYAQDLCPAVKNILTPELAAYFGPYLYTPEGLGEPIAIDLTGTDTASQWGLEGEEVYLALPNLSGHEQQLTAFLYILTDQM